MLKLLPLLSLVVGLAAGAGAAISLGPSEDSEGGTDTVENAEGEAPVEAPATEEADLEIVKLPSQFVVPVITDQRVRAMVVLSVALEVEPAMADEVRTMEPKLRDVFLSELFGLAAMDGFKDTLITRTTLELVKETLSRKAQEVLKEPTVTVLITDMTRQDAF